MKTRILISVVVFVFGGAIGWLVVRGFLLSVPEKLALTALAYGKFRVDDPIYQLMTQNLKYKYIAGVVVGGLTLLAVASSWLGLIFPRLGRTQSADEHIDSDLFLS